ncbi:MAG TPA: GTPase Era [Burkholderiaceae bacterium]|nr:GTPase Era [Burkholderiaceae bacterium]
MIAIVGRPNVGKSTLLNALVGSHISITSSKPQTTRNRVLGVATRADAQFVFVDTPGLQFRHKNLLSRRMNADVDAAIHGVDAIVMVVDAHGWCEDDDAVLRLLPRPPKQAADRALAEAGGQSALRGAPPSHVVLALSKTDTLRDRGQLLPLMAAASQRYPFAAIVPVSAARGWQLDELLEALRMLLPVGMPLFDEDQITDRSVRFLAAELLREQAFRLLGDELPYGLAVSIEGWEESEGRAVVSALILVERESQRAIVIGAGGAKLREIGRKARLAMERMLGKAVFLQTHVRVMSGWSNDARSLDRLGLEAPLRS